MEDEKKPIENFQQEQKNFKVPKKQYAVYLERALMERWQTLHPDASFTKWVRGVVEVECDELESQLRGGV